MKTFAERAARSAVLAGGVLFAMLLLSPAGASAGTITVSNLKDSGAGSLRAAIESAGPNEAITVPAGHILLTSGPLAIKANLAIAGAGAGATVIDGGDSSRLFTITASPSVSLSGMTLRGGNNPEGGAIYDTGGTLTLQGVAVTANHTGGGGVIGKGGGIYFEGPGELALADSSVSGNSAGGGAEAAGFGGGIDMTSTGNSQKLVLSLTRSHIDGNSAGGGSESAGFGGGVIASDNNEETSISLSIRSSTLSGNKAGSGGAEAPGFGGGLEVDAGGAKATLGLKIEDSAITGNVAGGLASSSGFGGGLDMSSGGKETDQTLTVSNTTFAGNTAGGGEKSPGFGGGVSFSISSGTSSATLSHVTVVGNSAGGEGAQSFGGGLNLQGVGPGGIADSIVASNPGGNCAAAVPSLGHNIDDGVTCGLHEPSDRSTTAPLLGPLGDHGGQSPTLMPLAGSPALDGANAIACPASDQRGVIRPQGGGCDIGAVEVAPPVVTTGSVAAVGSETATVGGSVNPNFSLSSYHVDFGATSAYGSSTSTASAGEGGAAAAVSAALTGLKPGTTYHFRVVATNAAGTVYGGDETLSTVVPVPAIGTPRLTNKRFRVGPRSTAVSAGRASVGTTVRFSLTASATVSLAITRAAPGLRHGGRCVAPSTALRRAHARRCKRTLMLGTLVRRALPVGANAIAFSGRIGRRPLAPGPYTAVLQATNAGGRSKAARLAFTVVR